MKTTNIFEYATRNKVRFTYKGLISVEDLWDLSVTELDKIFKTLKAQVKQSQEESLLADKSETDELLDIQIEIVRHIVANKLADAEVLRKAAEVKAQKQKIMAIISRKQDENLENMSVDDLTEMLKELGE